MGMQLNPREFLRVRHNAHSLNLLCLHFNGQHEQGPIVDANDQRRFTIDLFYLNAIVLWQKSPGGSEAEACHVLTSIDWTSCRASDFTAAIGPQGGVFG